MRFFVLIALVFAAAVVVCAKIDVELMEKVSQKGGRADFMVHVKDALSVAALKTDGMDDVRKGRFIVSELMAHSERTQGRVRSLLRARRADFYVLWINNLVRVAQGDLALVSELSKLDEVEAIVLDHLIPEDPIEQVSREAFSPLPVLPRDEAETHVKWVKADEVWKKGFTGKGIVIGLSDSGVAYKHEALVDSYRGNLGNNTFNHNYNWYDPTKKHKDAPYDTRMHGSHCQGIANGGKKGKKIGMAPGAQWIHCFREGEFTVIACLQFLLAPTDLNNKKPNPDLRPHVTSHSYLCYNCKVDKAIEALVAAGVFVAVANGNSGPRCKTATEPAFYNASYSVGALEEESDDITSFSSRGPSKLGFVKPNIACPGDNVLSASGSGSGYRTMSGTSMASPGVAGVVALLWEAKPQLRRNVAETINVLSKSARRKDTKECTDNGAYPNNVYGYGTINALAAVELK